VIIISIKIKSLNKNRILRKGGTIMSSKIKKTSKGFTIVELLIVIVVIGILAALVLNSFRGVQERARDTKRRTDVNAQASQLEVYYTDNGGYPVFTGQVNTDSVAFGKPERCRLECMESA
jgi:prepilin-type N-terminal cleavage/methylation domain-containing protein